MDSNQRTNPYLLAAALACFAAALAHLGIIVGGPEWYRWFGAGEQMAQMAEQRLWLPALMTLAISLALFACSLWGLSAAGAIRRLPLRRTALVLIILVFLGRGTVGALVMSISDDPYLQELQQRPLFLVVSSAICIAIGVCFLIGVRQRWRQLN